MCAWTQGSWAPPSDEVEELPALPGGGLWRHLTSRVLHIGFAGTENRFACGRSATGLHRRLWEWPVVSRPRCKDCFGLASR